MEVKQLKQCFGLLILLLVYSTSGFSQSINYDRSIKQYIVAEFSPNKSAQIDASKKMQVQKEHMQYIQSLAKGKKLVLAGPYLFGGGLFILNTTDEEQAKKWVDADPTIKNGINTYTLKKWMTEKGLFTLDNTKSVNEDYGKLNANAPKETLQYGQLVGKWDVEVLNLTKEGNWTKGKATWVFKYVMGGYAVQDYWTQLAKPNDDNSKDYFGSNIRIYNPDKEEWKTVWLESDSNNMQGVWTSYTNENNEIILHDDTKKWETKFYNITKDSFDWKWDFK
ncbi:YciI family protein, partial [Winogradskyella sp.]|uniref:YciI family protein n=1 Tax=Winogradskyella sp. TaxID=1883156 RepID=UPI00260ADD35